MIKVIYKINLWNINTFLYYLNHFKSMFYNNFYMYRDCIVKINKWRLSHNHSVQCILLTEMHWKLRNADSNSSVIQARNFNSRTIYWDVTSPRIRFCFFFFLFPSTFFILPTNDRGCDVKFYASTPGYACHLQHRLVYKIFR